MESQAATRRRTINRVANQNRDQNQRHMWSGSRDMSLEIRHDFVSSPWKRFRPSPDDIGQPGRRPLSTSSRNFRDFIDIEEGTRTFTAMQSKELRRHPLVIHTHRPVFTADLASCRPTDQHCIHLLSAASSSMDLQVPPITESRHPLNVRPRCPGFTVRADSRFHLASSTGQQAMSFEVFFVILIL